MEKVGAKLQGSQLAPGQPRASHSLLLLLCWSKGHGLLGVCQLCFPPRFTMKLPQGHRAPIGLMFPWAKGVEI